LSNTLIRLRVIVWRYVGVNTKIICKVTLSLGLLSPKPFFQGYPWSKGILLNLGIRFKTNYSSFTSRSSNSGAAERKGKKVKLSSPQKLRSPHPWMLMFFFFVFWISPYLWSNSGFWCCFPYYIDNFIIYI
jgi:hypothetical protein